MAVSFSAGVKAEICKAVPTKSCCALAQSFGVLLFCNYFAADGIRIVTESREFAHFLPKLFKKAFSVSFDSVPEEDGAGKLIFTIRDPGKLAVIMARFGFSAQKTLALQLNMPVVENSCCMASFLRGAFLAGGSVTDPVKGYHLELATIHTGVSRQTHALMQESMGFSPKTALRNGSRVLYFKQSDMISDVLTYLGAPVAAMGIMEMRLEKELNNKVNRRCNCDDANTNKVVQAAQEQLQVIRSLRSRGLLEQLPNKLLQAALAREEHPSASLSELAAMMEPPITKPAMNQRLKKLSAIEKEAGA